jgi:hypothetical protein
LQIQRSSIMCGHLGEIANGCDCRPALASFAQCWLDSDAPFNCCCNHLEGWVEAAVQLTHMLKMALCIRFSGLCCSSGACAVGWWWVCSSMPEQRVRCRADAELICQHTRCML